MENRQDQSGGVNAAESCEIWLTTVATKETLAAAFEIYRAPHSPHADRDQDTGTAPRIIVAAEFQRERDPRNGTTRHDLFPSNKHQEGVSRHLTSLPVAPRPLGPLTPCLNSPQQCVSGSKKAGIARE